MNYVASADWGVHFMENTCKNHDYAMPNKLFDYFMGGLPVIVSNLKEMSNFVKKHDVGYVIDLEQSNQAVDIIKNINKDSKKKFTDNVKKVSKEYTWEEQEKKLVKLYKSII
jgi:glycosyltransferase involved in cell wall biosynthesis